MRFPNGYGSVYKLSGKRRNPWTARITVGWEYDSSQKTSVQRFKYIGYYPTRKAALEALASYHATAKPAESGACSLTFAEVYERWSAEVFPTVSPSTISVYTSAYLICAPFASCKFADLKLQDYQMAADSSGKNAPMLRKYKQLLGNLYKYAIAHDLVSPAKNKIEFLNIKAAQNPNAHKRSPFEAKEIEKLWAAAPNDFASVTILMLIYTGCRIRELLDLKKEHVHLDTHSFEIVHAKTHAGIRIVPIADKIYPFFVACFSQSPTEYLLSTTTGVHFSYINYLHHYWTPCLERLSISGHLPHDTRHTCISLLAAAGVDERITKKIVGHKGSGVTESIYTHFHLQELLTAINKI